MAGAPTGVAKRRHRAREQDRPEQSVARSRPLTLRSGEFALSWIVLLCDLAAILLVTSIAGGLRPLDTLIALVALWTIAPYHAPLAPHAWRGITRIAVALMVGHIAIDLAHGHFGATTALVAIAVVVVERALVSSTVTHLRKTGRMQRPSLVVGDGPLTEMLVDTLLHHREYGSLPVHRPLPGTRRGDEPWDVDALQHLVDSLTVGRVFLVPDEIGGPIHDLGTLTCEVYLAFRNDSTFALRADDHVWGIPVIRIPHSAHIHPSLVAKRALDVIAASTAVVFAAPVLLFCAIAVKLSSRGPVLFRQVRVGQHGRTIVVTKFRTMRQPREINLETVDNADAGEWQRLQHDEARSRETRIGRFMRATSLDELPQLFDIVRGDLSLVGPRPELPHQVVNYSRDIDGYRDRHRMPVGLTGWAQIHGLRGETSLTERARFDNYYIDTWNIGRDMAIMLLTLSAVIRHAVQAFATREPR
jgi:lipopolysaccharide/colanic/teichoic acid biosynthesis glycosyltransferase